MGREGHIDQSYDHQPHHGSAFLVGVAKESSGYECDDRQYI